MSSEQQQKGSDAIIDSFQKTTNTDQMTQVLTELFNKSKISMITDLSKDEIRLITRMKMIANLHNLKTWDMGIQEYEELLLSHKRKSRNEILKAVGQFFSQMKSNPFENMLKKF